MTLASKWFLLFIVLLSCVSVVLAEEAATRIDEMTLITLASGYSAGGLTYTTGPGLLGQVGYQVGQTPNPFLVLYFGKTRVHVNEEIPFLYTYDPEIKEDQISSALKKWITTSAKYAIEYHPKIPGWEFAMESDSTDTTKKVKVECVDTYLLYDITVKRIALLEDLKSFVLLEKAHRYDDDPTKEHRKKGNTIKFIFGHSGASSERDGLVPGEPSTTKFRSVEPLLLKMLSLKCEKAGTDTLKLKVYATLGIAFSCYSKNGVYHHNGARETERIEGTLEQTFTCTGEEITPPPNKPKFGFDEGKSFLKPNGGGWGSSAGKAYSGPTTGSTANIIVIVAILAIAGLVILSARVL